MREKLLEPVTLLHIRISKSFPKSPVIRGVMIQNIRFQSFVQLYRFGKCRSKLPSKEDLTNQFKKTRSKFYTIIKFQVLLSAIKI